MPLSSLLILNQAQITDDDTSNKTSTLHKNSNESELPNSKKAIKKKSILCSSSSKQQTTFSSIGNVRFD